MTTTTHFALQESEGSELCKALGLAISNISMYGMEHSVTATAVTQAFDAVEAKTDLYGAVEFVTGDGGLMVNGSVVETVRTTGQIVMDQLMKLGVHDFEFQPPVSRGEFNQFMSILAAVPGSAAVSAGFEAAMTDAKLTSIRVSGVSYARVNKKEPPPPPPPPPSPSPLSTRRRSNSAGSKSFDLDMDLGLDDLESTEMLAGGESTLGFASVASAYLEQKRAADAQRQELLELIRSKGASLEGRRALREQLFGAGVSKEEWDDLLLASGAALPSGMAGRDAIETLQRLLMDVDLLASQGDAIAAGHNTEAMGSILEAIGQEVARLTTETKREAVTLVDKVDADRETVAILEAEARANGIGISLSRDELLSSLAEINQELTQPLTAASAVVDLLENGHLGDVSMAQKDALGVASRGMVRLGKLISYLSTISGAPEALEPDRTILDDAYAAEA